MGGQVSVAGLAGGVAVLALADRIGGCDEIAGRTGSETVLGEEVGGRGARGTVGGG